MSRYTGSSYKVSRRLKFSINESEAELKGKHKDHIPGQHGNDRQKKLTEYGKQLQEKQKIRYMYGCNERQFQRLFIHAKKSKGVTGVEFLRILESRLDNICYRMGLARTRAGARQLVNHGHILVDGKKVDIPSYICKPGQTIALKEASQNLTIVKEALEAAIARVPYVAYDEDKKVGTFVRMPERSEFLPEIKEQLIVEFYNR